MPWNEGWVCNHSPLLLHTVHCHATTPTECDMQLEDVGPKPQVPAARRKVPRKKARIRKVQKDKLALIVYGSEDAALWQRRVWDFIGTNRRVLGMMWMMDIAIA